MSLGLGVDLGAGSATAALVRRRGGSLAVEGFVHCSLDELELEGVDVGDPRQVARAVAARCGERGIRPRRAVIGVSGRDAIIRYSHLPPMPAWRMALLMEYEIGEVAEKTGEPLSSDYRILQGGDENLVLVALAKDARVHEQVEALQAAGIEVGGAMPQPVAATECFRFLGDDVDSTVTVVLDVGRSSTEVGIIEMGDLVFARSVAMGGDVFTERLERVLGLDRVDAEEVKVSGRTPEGDEVDEVLAPARQQLASMVSASVDFARKQIRRPRLQVERVVLAGGGARVPGLAEAIGSELACGAEVFDPFEHLDTSRADRGSREAAEVHGLEAITAIGLAFSAVLPAAVRLDLLPLAVKERLHFRHRTLWMYVAGGVLAAALLVSLSVGLWARSAQQGRADELTEALGQVQARAAALADLKAKNDSRHEELRRLADRARPGFHLAALLATLGSDLPREVTLGELRLEHDRSAGKVEFEAVGQADNAQHRGVAAMRELEATLAEDPRIARAKVQPLNPGAQSDVLEFRLTLEPIGNPAPEADAGEEG